VSFAAPIAGIAVQDLEVTPDTATEATGSGVKCTVLATTGGSVDALGSYPDGGSVSAEILMERGGPQLPEGGCLLTLQARGWDGADRTARGAQTLLLDAATVQAGGTAVVPEIVVRASQAVAGVPGECLKWVKQESKLGAKCNFLVLKKGPVVAAEKCRHAEPVPVDCDPGLHVEASLALAHGMNDQQADPASGEAVDMSVLFDGVKCQKLLGKAAQKYLAKRSSLVQKKCVEQAADGADCRSVQAQTARRKLDAVDKCGVDALVDGATGRVVPDVGTPCDLCIDGAGALDRKCLKGCFQSALDALSDGILGDVPVCGDGIPQAGEFCDDGNLDAGDGCSPLCGVEQP
jgi:cysteine-rich repeat protein